MNNVLGLIFSYSDRENLQELTKIRALSSVPFAGKYRIIDFILSNYVNSNIYDVSIITRNNFHSLVDHLGSGKEWDMTRKRGGLRILSPLSNPGSTDSAKLYRGTLEALHKNMHSIKRSMADYVILSGSSIICSIDYRDVLKNHIETNADITAIYARSLNGSKTIPPLVTLLHMDENQRITGASINKNDVNEQDPIWSLGIFVMKKSLLQSLVADAISYERYDFYADIIGRLASSINIIGYEYKKHIFEISTVTGYMKANLSLLSTDVRNKVFENPVYTKVKDSVPALYSPGCKISNSIISDGCIIEGTVINSVVSRGVRIGKDSVVKNSIIMQNTEIMNNVKLNHVILDKDVIVRDNRQLSGHETFPVVIEKLSIV